MRLQAGIRVTAICPGWVNTDMRNEGLGDDPTAGHCIRVTAICPELGEHRHGRSTENFCGAGHPG